MTSGSCGRGFAIGAILALAAAAQLGGLGAAVAADVELAVGAPSSAAVGDAVEVKVVVSSAGEPVAGAVVSLTYPEHFAGVEGRVELDQAISDESGTALFTYVQRADDNGEMAVSYIGPEEIVVEPFVFTIAVEPGAEQQFRSQAGVSIWWLNGWLVIGIILTIWALIVYAAIQLVLVGRAKSDEGPGETIPEPLGSESGSAWLAVLLAAVTIFTALGMGAVFLRNPLTHANLASPEGYNRTPVAHVADEYPFLGPGLEDPTLVRSADPLENGRYLYFSYGCSTCHFFEAVGGVVGPPIEARDFDDFARDVRRGVKEMPAYAEGALTDLELEMLFAYVESLEVTVDD